MNVADWIAAILSLREGQSGGGGLPPNAPGAALAAGRNPGPVSGPLTQVGAVRTGTGEQLQAKDFSPRSSGGGGPSAGIDLNPMQLKGIAGALPALRGRPVVPTGDQAIVRPLDTSGVYSRSGEGVPLTDGTMPANSEEDLLRISRERQQMVLDALAAQKGIYMEGGYPAMRVPAFPTPRPY